MKKQTNWITIPDDSTQDAVKNNKKSSRPVGEEPVKNKVFWGVAFVVLVFASFALLAPNQFTALLKGSLFDTSGLSEEEMTIDIKTLGGSDSSSDNTSADSSDSSASDSSGTDSADTSEDTGTSDSTSADSSDSSESDSSDTDSTDTSEDTSTSTTTSTDSSSDTTTADSSATTTDETVVEAEDEAVTISVTPLTTTTGEAEPEECEDVDCFLESLEDCSLSEYELSFTVLDEDFTADLEIAGEEDDECEVSVELTESSVSALEGQEMEVMIEKGEYTEEELIELLTDKDKLEEVISDTVPEDYAEFIAGVISTVDAEDIEDIVTSISGDTEDSQAKLIADLKKQIENLTKQRQEDVKTIQDIADTVIDQAAEATYPAATETSTTDTTITSTPGGTTTTGATTATTATGAIGQPSALTPGFRANPYTVSVTPQQMLAQNMGSTTSPYTAQLTTATQPTAYQQTASATQVVAGSTTPETGPSEVLFLTFVITFLGLVGWRFVRTFA